MNAKIPLLAVLSLVLSGGGPVVRAGSAPGVQAKTQVVFVTANNVSLQAGQALPVFKFAAPQVISSTTSDLSNLFTSVAGQVVSQDTYLGRPRFTVPNTDTNTLLEQYGATGGFYLVNAAEAFTETVRPGASFDDVLGQQHACQFLLGNGLFPANVIVPGPAQQCVFDVANAPYTTSEAWAASLSAQDGTFAQQQIGLLVQVPMSIDTAPYSQIPSVPLAGPGGHMSLLFRTTKVGDAGFTLDASTPGLAAAALPFHDRQFNFLRVAPAVDPAGVAQQIGDQLRLTYPGAAVTVTTPALVYMVSDAGTPQTALEPKLDFAGIQVTSGGQTIVLKDLVVPAVQSGPIGFGPLVTITAPLNGSTFVPGAIVNFSASLSGGTAPYTYTWALSDGTVLGTGTLPASSQTIPLSTNQLPVVSHSGLPASVTVQLFVEDGDGAQRTTFVSLTPTVAPSIYLPLALRNSGASLSLTRPPALAAPTPTSPQDFIGYRFGIEEASDYPPYGPGGADLGGVPPDVGGFNTQLLSYGWSRTFHWANALAWERDWRDCGLGGIDCTWGVDRADFVYFSGHGFAGGISMPSNVDSPWFVGNSARFQSIRWVGFSSCQTLRVQGFPPPTEPIRLWFNAFQGAHMLLGFNSNMGDIAFGAPLIDNMRMPFLLGVIPMPWAQRTIREAWVQTAFNMNAGKPAYIYAVGANGVNPVNDRLPSPAFPLPVFRPFPVASWHWVWWNE